MGPLICLLAPAVGSFLGVLYDRLPRGEDILRTPSRCRACGHRLSLPELLPLVSWLSQRGQCRVCGAAIPAALPLIELAAAAFPFISLLVARNDAEMAAGCLFAWILIPLAAIDLRHGFLPNVLTASLFATGLFAALAVPPPGLSDALLGATLGAGGFLALRFAYFRIRGTEGLGLGDVKLMAGLGTWLGPQWLPLMVVIAAAAGLATTFLRARRHHPRISRSTTVSFGAYLCGSAILVWFLKIAEGLP